MERPPPDPALIGQVLDGRYRLDALLGHGGMGAVYRGTHVHLDTRVAIKVLRPHLAGDATAARRFAREAKGTFQLDTEHAIKVSDFGYSEGGLLYMVMELLDGRTVAEELAVDGALAPARAARVAAQVCDALAAAHRLGFLHRDIKPENVMLLNRGGDADFVKVLDFGLAKLIDGSPGTPFSLHALTQKDMVFGTPEYMAPEQAMGQSLDGRADLYAVGSTLFEMLTCRPPFMDSSPMRLLAHHVKTPPPALREVVPSLVIPDALEVLVRRCLAKAVEHRPPTAETLAAELRALVPQLGAAPPRVPKALASSATVDLDAHDAPTVAAPSRQVSSANTELVSTRGLRRGTRITLAAITAVALALGAVVVVALTRTRTPRPASRSASVTATVAATLADAGAQVPATDAAAATVAATDAGGATVAATDAGGSATVAATVARTDAVLAKHLAAAEAARRGGNRLRQLAEADAALNRSPKHARARFLMGEALLETGDVANGCRYLRAAKAIREARSLLSSRCPSD